MHPDGEAGARLVSICSGVFVLATGLLDGKRATTDWRYAARLASRYPGIRVEPDRLYVDEGSILTSVGSAAGLAHRLLLIWNCDHKPKFDRTYDFKACHAAGGIEHRSISSGRRLADVPGKEVTQSRPLLRRRSRWAFTLT